MVKLGYIAERRKREELGPPKRWAVMQYQGRELPYFESLAPPNWKTMYDPMENMYYILVPERDVHLLECYGCQYLRPSDSSGNYAPDFAPPAELIEYLSNEWRTDDQSEK